LRTLILTVAFSALSVLSILAAVAIVTGRTVLIVGIRWQSWRCYSHPLSVSTARRGNPNGPVSLKVAFPRPRKPGPATTPGEHPIPGRNRRKRPSDYSVGPSAWTPQSKSSMCRSRMPHRVATDREAQVRTWLLAQ
jgi:hypothetical protein